MSWWLLFGGGLHAAGGWFGRNWQPGRIVRRACLAFGFSIYYIRVLFTEFVFLKRGMSWSEVFTIAPWILCIYLLLDILGGANSSRPGAAVGAGVILFVAGSWMNSYAEYERNVGKSGPKIKDGSTHRGYSVTRDIQTISAICFRSPACA